MSKPECLGCIWFRKAIPLCNCPFCPPICEWDQSAASDGNKEIDDD